MKPPRLDLVWEFMKPSECLTQPAIYNYDSHCWDLIWYKNWNKYSSIVGVTAVIPKHSSGFLKRLGDNDSCYLVTSLFPAKCEKFRYEPPPAIRGFHFRTNVDGSGKWRRKSGIQEQNRTRRKWPSPASCSPGPRWLWERLKCGARFDNSWKKKFKMPCSEKLEAHNNSLVRSSPGGLVR